MLVNATNQYQKTSNEIRVIKTKSCGYLNKRKEKNPKIVSWWCGWVG